MSSRTIPVFLLVALSAACGGIADVLPDGGNADSGGGDGNIPDASPGPDCPAQMPSAATACSHEGVQCEYGGDPRWTCNTIATCNQGHWSALKESDPSCPTPQPNPQACPATYEQAQKAGACTALGTICDYSTSSATQFCSCFNFGGPVQLDGGGATWMCNAGGDPSCPAVRPRVGSSCSSPSTYCSYDVCGLPSGLGVQCDPGMGTWVTSPGDVCAGAQ